MSKEMQIEEMAKIISEKQNGGWKFVGDSEYTTDVSNEELAEHLYEQGCRKQSEGEWLVNAWSEKSQKWIVIPYIKHQHIDPFCSLCKEHALLDGAEFGVASNYCPNCGAKMKGGGE